MLDQSTSENSKNSNPEKRTSTTLTMKFLEITKNEHYVHFSGFQKNPEKRIFTPHHLDHTGVVRVVGFLTK